MKINLADKSLFGNEAAEDEIEDVFTSYAVERSEVGEFLSPENSLAIARAYKGEGKSALLRLASINLKVQDQDQIVIFMSAPSLSPNLETDDINKWLLGWKSNIVKRIADEIGARISMAFSDDAISLVEEAERNNFKSRSIVSAIVDRIHTSKIPIKKESIVINDAEKLVSRWAEKKNLGIWLLLDEVDKNFKNTHRDCAKVAGFFDAIRQLCILIPQLKMRATVRPNVWTLIMPMFESMSHVKQYIFDLRWEQHDYYELLARRIKGYLKRKGQTDILSKLSNDPLDGNKQLISLIFRDPMQWGGTWTRPPAIILHTLSRKRPRWLIELCSAAARAAAKDRREIIEVYDIRKALDEFGRQRVEDTVSEFMPQCPQIRQLIEAFAGQPECLSTENLISMIKLQILKKTHLDIGGFFKPTPYDVAHFLFQIGFINARKSLPESKYKHITFTENPLLLHTESENNSEYTWEIHPVFRTVLKLTNVSHTSEHIE